MSNSVDERTTIETRLPTIPKRPRKAVQIPSIKNLIIDNIVAAKKEKTLLRNSDYECEKCLELFY